MSKLAAVSDQDQVQGEADAEYTLVEYGDYECPPCGQLAPLIRKLQKRLGARLRFVFRNYPLDQHEYAEPAAKTALFAAEHGKFWEMHDLLFNNQAKLSDEIFPKLAKKLGLDPAEMHEAFESGKFAASLKRDRASGDKAGVRGTPSLFVNGVLYDDALDVETLVKALQGSA